MGDKKTILIVGRSGNGKTSLAKSIAEKRNCKTYYLDKELKPDLYLQVKQYDGARFNVLDCSCIGDSEEDAKYDFDTIKSVAEKAIEIGEKSGRIDAIVFTMKYGVRYTKQESDAVDIVKRLFGEYVFSKRVVLAFSYGDIFDYDNDTVANNAFHDWCRQQQGSIRKLFEEVNYRCVLFDNKTEDHEESLKQLELFIIELAKKDIKYTLQVVPIDNEQQKQPNSQVEKLKQQHEQQYTELETKQKKELDKLQKKHITEQTELKNKQKKELDKLKKKLHKKQEKERKRQPKQKKKNKRRK